MVSKATRDGADGGKWYNFSGAIESLEDGERMKGKSEEEKWIKSSEWERVREKNKLNNIIEFYRLKNVILLPHDLIKKLRFNKKII